VTFAYISPFLLIRRLDSATAQFNNEDGQMKPWLHKHNKMAEGPKNVANVTNPQVGRVWAQHYIIVSQCTTVLIP